MTESFDDRDALAAEYVLGTLDDGDRARAEELMARDHAFAQLVEDWNRRLIPATEAIAPEEPPARLWHNIQAALQRRTAAPDVERLALGEHRREIREPLLTRLAFWRWSTAAMTAVAAALALYIGFAPIGLGPDGDGRYVAVLGEGAQEPAWLVTVDLAENRLTIRPVTEIDVADRSLELWMLAGDQPPRSLGLLSPQQPVSLPLSAAPADFQAGSALAVSLEPEGGSPTGLPTGPVVYQGALLETPPDS